MFAGDPEELEFRTEVLSLLNNLFCSLLFSLLRIAAPNLLAMGFFFYDFEFEPELILFNLSLLTLLCLLTLLFLLL